MDRSLEAIGSKHTAIPSPREEIFSKPHSRSEKSCHYIASKKGIDEADSKNESWTTDDGNPRWYVNPGDVPDQPRSDELGSAVDDDEKACYNRSPEHETQTEDTEEEIKRKRRSCIYQRKSIDY